jgi:hypothetical protein
LQHQTHPTKSPTNAHCQQVVQTQKYQKRVHFWRCWRVFAGEINGRRISGTKNNDQAHSHCQKVHQPKLAE